MQCVGIAGQRDAGETETEAHPRAELGDSMGRAARTWQLRRCNLTDGVPRCPSRTT
jgi:hypothetical protein